MSPARQVQDDATVWRCERAVTKTLYVLGGVMLMAAGIFAVLCAAQWQQEALYGPDSSISGETNVAGNANSKMAEASFSPVVVEATAFAQYLKTPADQMPARPEVPIRQAVPRPAMVTPKFRLLSTSYYRSRPEKSLALIAEPGTRGHWIGKGDRLGRLVVENVTDGGLICRDGDRRIEMVVPVGDRTPLASLKSDTLEPLHAVAGSVNPVKANAFTLRLAGEEATIDEGLE